MCVMYGYVNETSKINQWIVLSEKQVSQGHKPRVLESTNVIEKINSVASNISQYFFLLKLATKICSRDVFFADKCIA